MSFVTKANGVQEEFSEEKLLASIQRAGIAKNLQSQVLAHIKTKLHNGIPTSQIYHHIVEFLDTNHPYSRSKYSLKESLMQLGPTGYPFEKFLARLLEREGFSTVTNQMLYGTCVVHEVDIVAQKDEEKIMIEAKFHNTVGIKTDLHVSLYTKARFDDLSQKHEFTKAMLITNTKASIDAITFAECTGMDIITWGFPQKKSLADLIEQYHLHPITSLQTLSQNHKQQLLSQNIVLCTDIVNHPESLSSLFLTEEKVEQIIDEAFFVSSSSSD